MLLVIAFCVMYSSIAVSSAVRTITRPATYVVGADPDSVVVIAKAPVTIEGKVWKAVNTKATEGCAIYGKQPEATKQKCVHQMHSVDGTVIKCQASEYQFSCF